MSRPGGCDRAGCQARRRCVPTRRRSRRASLADLARLGDEEHFIPEGDGIFIPKNVPCRLENCGRIALEIVSVLEGEYLGEGEA